MDNINLSQNIKREIGKIRKLYWIWYSDFIRAETVSRSSQWRINNLVLKPGIAPKLINMDVTGSKFTEEHTTGTHGSIFQCGIEFFSPSIDEFLESYLNEMIRRPVCLFVEDFEDRVWLLGGQNPKTSFSFKKAIDGRNGYVFSFMNSSVESSLIINDEDFFPAAAPSNNITWTDSDGSIKSTPVGSPIVCQPGSPTSGIFFHIPKGPQYTSYEDEDDGWLIQNGFYNDFEPAAPEMVARLDLNAGADYGLRMAENMTVGGQSNNWRYVDRNGLQVFPSAGNKDLTFIDKLLGLEWYRGAVITSARNWADTLAFARSHSIVIDGETCNDWIVPTIQMLQGTLGSQPGGVIYDHSMTIWLGANDEIRSSTTYLLNTGYAWVKHGGANGYSAAFTAAGKTILLGVMLCRKATHLISI